LLTAAERSIVEPASKDVHGALHIMEKLLAGVFELQ
jgi:hypothetical protein